MRRHSLFREARRLCENGAHSSRPRSPAHPLGLTGASNFRGLFTGSHAHSCFGADGGGNCDARKERFCDNRTGTDSRRRRLSGTAASCAPHGTEVVRENVDCVVIGAGVVGLAVARELAMQGREVVVVEAADGIGTGTSSRSSEVIHAGIYYPPGSLKARLCVEGKQALYAYCKEREIPHDNVTKLIVATGTDQIPVLEKLASMGKVNGVNDLRMISGDEAMQMEPALKFDYVVDPRRGEKFYDEIRKYYPALPDGSLQAGYSGIRSKLSGRGQPPADFLLQGERAHGIPGLIQLYGFESPGLTSSLAIAKLVSKMAKE